MIIVTFFLNILDHVSIFLNCCFHVFFLVDVLHYIRLQDRRTVSPFLYIYFNKSKTMTRVQTWVKI